MNLMDNNINKFIDLLASEAPAPGGGASVALIGAIGIALTSMVGNLTLNREKYKDYEELINKLISEATDVKNLLIEAIDRDTKSYNNVIKGYKLPKNTEQEKEVRKNTIEKALKESTLVPFDVMFFALQSLKITEKAVGKSNINVVSDLGVAALSLKATIQGAYLNVAINLQSIKDKEFVKEYETKSISILEEAIPLADKIYEEVKQSILK